MNRLLPFLLALFAWLAPPVAAQDDDDVGFLTGLLQDSLSGAGREVKITGFQGALSAQARMEQMTISDADGVWLTIRDVELDWKRSDLFRGALTVETFRAGEIDLKRLPDAGDSDPPPPETTPFSLPDLPVSISIANLEATRITLGEAVLGLAAELGVKGSAMLDGQALDIDITAQRTDDTRGVFAIATSYAPDTTDLNVDVTLDEDAGGLTSRLLALPGLPSVKLTLKGAAPVADFTADLQLDTDGEERLAGQIRLTSPEDGLSRLGVDIAGDITPLLPPEQRRFFDKGVSLVANAAREEDGGIALDRMQLRTGALALSGSLRLDPQFWPRFADITAELADPAGQVVRLPVAAPVELRRATLAINYDETRGNDWIGQAVVDSLATDMLTAVELRMDGGGTIDRAGNFGVGALTAGFDLVARGLKPTDPGLAKALGSEVDGRLDLTHRAGEPLKLSRFDLSAGDVGFSGRATIQGIETGLDTDLRMALQAPDLMRFDGLTGMPLTGAADLQISGNVIPLSGAFAFEIDGSTTELRTGTTEVDALLGGKSLLNIAVTRGEEGVELTRMTLASAAISFAANGSLATNASALNLAAQLPDIGPLTPEGFDRSAEGSARVSGTARLGQNFTLASANLTAHLGNGDAPVRLPLGGELLQFTAATLDTGLSGGRDGLWRLDAAVEQPQHTMGRARVLQLTGEGGFDGTDTGDLAQLAGQVAVALEGLRLVDPALAAAVGPSLRAETNFRFPDIETLVLDDVKARSAASTIAGTVTVAGLGGDPVIRPDITLDSDLGAFSRLAGQPLGGSLAATLSGSAQPTAEAYDLVLNGTANNLSTGQAIADRMLSGETTINTALSGRGNAVTLTRLALNNANLTASAEGALAPAPDLLLSARLADVATAGVALSGPLSARGTLRRPAEDWLIDMDATGPGGITSDVEGRLRGDGTLALSAGGAAPLGLANTFIAPNRVEGTANYNLRIDGQPSLSALTGSVTLNGGQVSVPSAKVSLQDIAANLSLASGRAALEASAINSKGGRLAVSGPVSLTAPFPADLTATLTRVRLRDPALFETKIDGTVTMTGPLTGGAEIAGRIVLDDTNLQIPSTGLGGFSSIPEIDHVGASGSVQQTRQRAGLVEEETEVSGGPVYGLNLRVVAPGRIFIRGRGLDAELGGRIDLGGTTADIVPSGRFDLVRGRLSILDRRLEMTDGYAQILGDFDAYVRLVATTKTEEYDIDVVVEGPASEPEVSFTSSPDLPESEVIAQLLFGRDLTSLSAFQALQLANAVATLAGGGNSTLNRLRENVGLDDLDVTTDEEGNTGVRAGKYISDNVYTDVTVEPDGTSEINLNLDISKSVSAKGGFTSEGDSSIGLFFEKDY